MNGVSVCVNENEIVALLGPNGAGKTTFMRTISGLVRAAQGKIFFDGEEITHWAPENIVLRKKIIHVPQGRHVFGEMSVAENLELGAYSNIGKHKQKDLYDKVYSLFPKLYERRRQIAGTLSGGEQQMLAVGRALMAEPRLLIMDEPSMGLAPIIIHDLYLKISEIAKLGTTIFLVEQNALMAFEVAERAYFLDVGDITTSGKVEDLRHEDIVQAYLGI
ncbi:MAG: ABC transporter ATP-binding protein [Synergistaceae bacterium]|nr:ABC transporter ATP-binding protein [Synergistaceae bacterium]